MYLKSIEVQGFKSFANKIAFRFNNGITGIVGPNGSGKSNVADAVRWVLGEQRAKQLRGGSMQDVIFSGTQTRKPMGYASVSITLDNSDHILPVSYEEVTVTRRLYRSGESEYMLNGSAVRLKDINELFFDTGIGKDGYSIIGQGQVETILNGKPEERRELFDEAVGIVKYKKRRQEAQKKLDNGQQNLIRIGDVVSELERRVGPLERQAEKAKIFLKKRDEMKAYDVNLYLNEYQEAKAKLDEARRNAEEAQAELDDVKLKAAGIREQYDELQAVTSSLEETHSGLQKQITDDKLGITTLEGQIELLREQIRQGREGSEQQIKRLQELSADLKSKREDEQKVSDAALRMKEQAEQIGRESLEGEQNLYEVQQERQSKDEEMQSAQDDLYRILSERTSIQSEISRYDAMIAQQRIRLAQIDRQVLKYHSDESRQKEELLKLEEESTDIENQLRMLQEKSGSVNEQLEACQEKLNEATGRLEEENTKYHREASRLEALRGIAERYDGYGNSIRRVMEQKSRYPGILGVVADLLRTKKEYETAIETALGGSIQNIVTEDEDTARDMIAFLKENRYGRATFLPLTAMKEASFTQKNVLKEEGVIGLADTLVETDDRYRTLVSQLLGRSIVVDRIDHAIALARRYHYSLRIVTLGGELLTPGGAMTGGAFKNSSSLLSRRREIDELKGIVARREKKLQDLRESIERLRDERTDLRKALVSVSEEIQRKNLEQNTASMRSREMENRSADTQKQTEIIEKESRQLKEEAQSINEKKKAESDRLRQSEREEVAVRWKLEQLGEEQENLARQESELMASLEQIHLQLQSAQQKKDFLETDALRLQGEIFAMEEEEKSLKSSQSSMGSSIAAKEDQIKAAEEKTKELSERLASLSEKEKEVAGAKENNAAQLRKAFEKREELSEQAGLLEKETARLESQIERMEEKQESRSAYMWEEYELTYASALPLKRDDLGSKSEWRKKMNLLKTEIRDLGPVNVSAIEEYKEVSERYTFLKNQQEDILKAQKALEKIIEDLNVGMQKQFKEQFARIQEEFDKSFKELFGGGSGTLELVDETDLLETGIRIIAQPPGKKLQNMMQMSGGEKSLTAIALLFAIQNLKPSPFCLLDEIEAALDESNVDRYASYLHKLTKHTQFIIITHRRGTMAAADRLYGITMQEKGISALVSVDLIEGQLDK